MSRKDAAREATRLTYQAFRIAITTLVSFAVVALAFALPMLGLGALLLRLGLPDELAMVVSLVTGSIGMVWAALFLLNLTNDHDKT